VSSIHVNGWFGRYDKLSMTRTLLAEAFGIDLDAERERFVFVGDSRTTRRCSRSSRMPWVSPTSAPSPTASRRCRRG